MSASSTWRKKITQTCRGAAKAAFPKVYQFLSSYRFRQHCKKRYGKFQNQVRPLLYGGAPPTVLSGPFQGLPYLDEVGLWGPILPKWIGSYEDELHPFLERLFQSPPSVIVDVGAAEGYYAVLLAARLPDTVVHAFDIDPFARRAQARLARLNQISNLRINLLCTFEELGKLLGPAKSKGLLFCDIEGGETFLIDPMKCPALRDSVIVVELHETKDSPGESTRNLLQSRFQDSHDIEYVSHAPKSIPHYLEITRNVLSPADLSTALNEVRGASRGYLIMHPRQSA
ncbi:hypothetical protein DES53_101915 [Roseimicrobium gellanilyticum]|uniref:FkbM family methyltransferase n=1 Tax=Roseimicrobium gellanilyticum TaxID=748857 RepID=A0A366HXA1_9BACT|nr:class I SAM-dependent methyltransferase [Roseimicrobium gellanilyticum]RBP48115.1 hypothetical protein DES53_101915 [Roseimicrobium gellanilyticum]